MDLQNSQTRVLKHICYYSEDYSFKSATFVS